MSALPINACNSPITECVHTEKCGLGIGLEHDECGRVVIADILPGYGAFAGGNALQVRDVIHAVDGKDVSQVWICLTVLEDVCNLTY